VWAHELLEGVRVAALRPQYELALARRPALHRIDYTAQRRPVPS
jgi:hypothetical protein